MRVVSSFHSRGMIPCTVSVIKQISSSLGFLFWVGYEGGGCMWDTAIPGFLVVCV